MTHPLDRPVWSALNSQQSPLAEGDGPARRFPADVSPLAGMADAPGAPHALAALMRPGESIALLQVEPPTPPAGVQGNVRGGCVQMTLEAPGPLTDRAPLVRLGDEDAAQMLALAQLTRLGPFCARTHTLGRFIGIRDGARLIAMAGERLHVDGYREVSAVCTHPDYRGRGYGAALLGAVAHRIRGDGETPFLHSYATNHAAIALYHRLGFRVRAQVMHVEWTKAP
jgi:ribosomal protein S18 acetylase RimI-like enzyme